MNTTDGENKRAPSGGYDVLTEQERAAFTQNRPKLRLVEFELRKAANMLFMVIPVPDGLTEKLLADVTAQISYASHVLSDQYDFVITHLPPLGVAGPELAVEAVWKTKLTTIAV